MCSLWLWTDSHTIRRFRLRAGNVEREGGASAFCRLEDALCDGMLKVGLQLEEDVAAEQADAQVAPAAQEKAAATVHQSLQLTGLQLAEWRIFDVEQLLSTGELVTSSPFRFHHVLLGDMYLELLPGVPHPEHCTVFFRCRVPTMKLRVEITAGEAFSRSFVALGRSACEADLKDGNCLGVNLSAPGVLQTDGSLVVRCALEEVVLIPGALRDMIPKLDERAHWPKRL